MGVFYENIFRSIVILIISIMIASTSSNVFTKDKIVKYFNEYKNIVEDMYKTMKSLPESKNVDIDYLNEMITHHESAVNMSKNYIKYNKWTKEIKVIAENIIANQGESIKHMDSLIKEIEKSNQGDITKESQYLIEYNDILNYIVR